MDWTIGLTVDHEWQKPVITKEAYEEFDKAWVLYILKEYRYGQAFCEHFNIGNATPLYYLKDETISKRWIADNYLQR